MWIKLCLCKASQYESQPGLHGGGYTRNLISQPGSNWLNSKNLNSNENFHPVG